MASLSSLRVLYRKAPATSLGIATGTGLLVVAHAVEYRTINDSEVMELPRAYNAHAIDSYWMSRPVTASQRLLQIVYELGPVGASFVLQSVLPASSSYSLKQEQQQVHLAKRLRQALTNLGPSFVKVGQQISIRPDLVPPVVLKELQLLCDSVEPISDELAFQVLREELGIPEKQHNRNIMSTRDAHDDTAEGDEWWNQLFVQEPQRKATASLGQVYKATLRSTGQEVAIKVQRPDTRRMFSLDLFWLHRLGILVDQFTTTFTQQPPFHQALYASFAQGSYGELDYEQEAAHQMYFAQQLAERKVPVVVPAVYKDLSTEKVLTTAWIDGVKLADCPPEQIRQLIPVGVTLFLTQLLDIGEFHSDPHPGNVLVSNETGQLCLLDFGLVTKVPQKERNAMTAAIVHLLTRDFDALISKDAIELGFLPVDFDTTELQPLLTKILTAGVVESGSNMHQRKKKLQEISAELNQVFFQYPFTVPPFFALVTRGLGLLEGIALVGDPDFDIFQASAPYARQRAVALVASKAFFRRKMTQQAAT